MAKFLRVLSTYYDNREFRIKEPMGGMQKYRKAAEKV
jgi:hypothetical protein